MEIATLLSADRMVQVMHKDGTKSLYPYIWLRDNDPSGFHPQTNERLFDLTSIPIGITASAVQTDGGFLTIHWENDDHVTQLDLEWLYHHQLGQAQPDPANITSQTYWRSDLSASGVPRASWAAVVESDEGLLKWMLETQEYGLSIVDNIPDDLEAGIQVAKRISFLRQTNFGTIFEVESKPNPNNLAYTPVALPLHTDLPNQEIAPGFQFLHCIANEAQGGGSMFCDGFAVAEDLRKNDPEAYELLTTVSIPFRFHDETCDIRKRKHVLEIDDQGAVYEICFNGHLADIFDMAPQLMERYYRAYRTFMQMLRSPAYEVTMKLKGGEMVVFDNRRVLHGRQAFDPSTGYRRLRGCYVDRGEFNSRLRVLSRN